VVDATHPASSRRPVVARPAAAGHSDYVRRHPKQQGVIDEIRPLYDGLT